MRTKFIILFQGRTGSSHLQECLASHPHVICKGEELVRKSQEEQEQWIADLYDADYSQEIRAVGFKTKLRDFANLASLEQILRKRNIKIIYMYRENMIKQAFSRINARRLFDERQVWNLPKDQAPLAPAKLTIEQMDEAIAHHEELQTMIQTFIARQTQPIFTIRYEDLYTDQNKIFAQLCAFLGIKSMPMDSGLQKNTKDNVRDSFLNYDTIKAHYQTTKYAEYF